MIKVKRGPTPTMGNFELGEDYDPCVDRQQYVDFMEESGFLIRYPKPNELFLDLDTKEAYNNYLKALEVWSRNTERTIIVDQTPSKSGTGWHVVVTMPFEMDNLTRIAYQGAFGSDNIRELLSLFRLKNNVETPTLFAERGDFE